MPAGAVEDAEDDLLAVRGREDRDAKVHRLLAEADRDAAVLRGAPLGDVEPAHDLQARGDCRLQCLRDRRDPACDAVDAGAHDELALLGLEMDVRRAFFDRLCDHLIDEADGRRCRGGAIADVFDREVGRKLIVHALDDLDVVAIGAADRVHEVARVRHRQLELEAEHEVEVVGGDDVRRVGHGDEDRRIVEEAHRERDEAARELLGEQHGRRRVDLELCEVDEREARLIGERLGDGARGRPAALDEHLAEPAAAQAHVFQCELELLRADHAGLEQERTELATAPIDRRQRMGEMRRFHRRTPIGNSCERDESCCAAGFPGLRRARRLDRGRALHPPRSRRDRPPRRCSPACREDREAARLRGR